MTDLRKYVFIADINIKSIHRINDLYKHSSIIKEGMLLKYLSLDEIFGTILFTNVVSESHSLKFKVFIENDKKTMFKSRDSYVNAIKNCLQSIMILDCQFEINIIKLRIPDLLIQGKLNPKVYKDLDEQYYLLKDLDYIQIESPKNQYI